MKHFRYLMAFAMAISYLGAYARTYAEGVVVAVPKVAPAVADVATILSPADVHIAGWLGERIAVNETNRLREVDTVPLLAGYHKRPGNHPWIGEHVGKWMHAATLAWVNSGDPLLRAKLDHVAAELISCQEPDGYLGTYLPEKRFGLYKGADWDVWSHKYNMLGLLTYYEYTGDMPALEACRKMGDLLIATFPAKRSILAAGTHQGMAATSVLEPIVLLYRQTGDKRYLDFARYIVSAWDNKRGPKILTQQLSGAPVNKTANGKAYEMLSNLVGLCEFYRATGEPKYLNAVKNAWQDIVTNRLYITGSASSFEHFQDDHRLPRDAKSNICETCVTVTWLQLNLQLLRLTGEAKYGDELERALYNHLTAAQRPDGGDWCYYTPLEGKKQYDAGITCCHSSGPRGLALAPQTAYLCSHDKQGDTLLISTFESSKATLELDGTKVTIEQQSDFPLMGRGVITVRPDKPASFAIYVRVPSWLEWLRLNGDGTSFASRQAGWLNKPKRLWHDGDTIHLTYDLTLRAH